MHIRIIDRYLFREGMLSWVAITLILFAIMISHTLLRVLLKASGGLLSVDAVLPLLFTTSINLLVTIVPLGLYLGVVLGLGRLYQDSEVVVLSACGVGVWDLYRPVAALGVVGILVTFPLTTWVSPWAESQEQNIKLHSGVGNLAALMREDKFVESQGGDVVLFARTLTDPGVMRDVFMRQQISDGREALESAKAAQYQLDDHSGDQYLVFLNGQRATFGAAGGNHQRIEFAKHGVRVPEIQAVASKTVRAGRSTLDLMRSKKLADRAEFYWRIGIPFAAPLLALLALPLSHTSPRKGRYGRVSIAILIYIIYANLLVLSRKWISAGQIPEWLGLWWVHALLLCTALGWLRHTHGITIFARSGTPLK